MTYQQLLQLLNDVQNERRAADALRSKKVDVLFAGFTTDQLYEALERVAIQKEDEDRS